MIIKEGNINIGNDLAMCPIGRNENTTAFVMNKSSKLYLCNDGEDPKEQVKNDFVTNEKKKLPAENNGPVERLGKYGRQPKKEQFPPREW